MDELAAADVTDTEPVSDVVPIVLDADEIITFPPAVPDDSPETTTMSPPLKVAELPATN